MFEATIGPSLILISSQWYTKSEQAPRFSFWYLGLGLGQILGGAVSYAFQHITPASSQLSGWRIMFLALGLVTVTIGILTTLFVPDTPMKARWLSDGEKVALLKHVSTNMTGIDNKTFRLEEIFEALMDPQMYLMLLSVVLVSLGQPIGESLLTGPARLLQRCRDDLLGHSDPKSWLRPQAGSAYEYAFRDSQHIFHSPCRLRRPQAIPAMGLDHRLPRPCVRGVHFQAS